ncbi:family 16 glycoside hydrolase [Flavitalea flava]
MKNILSALLLFCAFTTATAQTATDQRTVTTKIADLLARIPASNKEELQTAMTAISSLGQDGLTEMASMLAAPGSGDNTRLEYALGNFSYYTTQTGNETLRESSARAYCQALTKTADKENKAFIIRQLQITATDGNVSFLTPYLNDERLCDPAARSLVAINTPAANKGLLEALQNAKDDRQLTLVEALGDTRSATAASFISALAANPATGKNEKLTKLSLYALSRIGDPGSERILAKAAEKAGYGYDVTGATDAYISYARQLIATGKNIQATKIAGELLTKATGDQKVAARCAALNLLVTIQGNKSIPLLIVAMDDKNEQYREAALKYAGPFTDAEATGAWVKKLTGSSTTVKGEIITMLGNTGQSGALPAVLNALKDKESSVRLRAVKAAGQIGQQQALPALLAVLKKDDPAEVAAVKNALLIMKGNTIPDEIGSALAATAPHAKAALVEVLAARGADSRVNDVLPLVKSTDTTVSKAAFIALKDLATPQTLPQLFALLVTRDQPGEIHAVQQAIIAGSAGIGDSAQRTSRILTEMKQATAGKQYLFFDILAAVGGKEAQQIVSNGFEAGNEQAKKAVVSALSNWPDASAILSLNKISRQAGDEAYINQAITGIVHLTSRSGYPAEQKLLILRQAMEIAKTTAQQQLILKEAGKCKTFIALLFAGNFLDNAALQQDAALAVMNIALADKTLSGEIVRKLLEKASSVLKGQDSDYQRQAIRKYLAEMPAGEGIVSLFNGTDLSGWKGLVANPILRAKMDAATLEKEQQKADEDMRKSWKAVNGQLEFSGSGENLCTVKKYGDFEMYVDWKIDPDGDAGIYLRGSPQVQIWDTSRRDVGAQVGSGGLYNNAVYPSKPLKLADNAIGDWNSFHIIMKGDRVTVYLNGELTVDNVILENYWDRKTPIFPEEQIELQAHGRHVAYRDLYVREIPRPIPYTLAEDEKKEGFDLLFDGTNMYQWTGNTTDYVIEDDHIAIYPKKGDHGNLYTKNEYSDFVYRFEFQLTPGANNGIGIRAPLEGDAAYVGMEIQVLDNEAPIYKNLHEYQYHGSVYGVIPAKRGYLKPTGEWNVEEITAVDNHIKVILNGTTILDGDISDAIKNGTLDKKDHPGLKNTKGHLGFLGHGDVVKFRHMRVKDLSTADSPAPSKKKKK